ncbi:hypothetical protein B0H17DRAFT_1134667 [Mycena rosella]|uniref:Uncharacterized protein n=1 Tax=Mycena rosella TaxID=1033263 RepID=A0AAD7DFB7_MYCRO|nr:hypothetical protein B0H17DRAFT_1134667 [Mycena rosella]
MSDPKETGCKELTERQYCYKSKGPGVSLQKCGACQVDLYCSETSRLPPHSNASLCGLQARGDLLLCDRSQYSPIDTFPSAQEMCGQLKQASEDNKRTGMAGALFAILLDTDSATLNIAPVRFPKTSAGPLPPLAMNCEQWLTKRLNNGIVV